MWYFWCECVGVVIGYMLQMVIGVPYCVVLLGIGLEKLRIATVGVCEQEDRSSYLWNQLMSVFDCSETLHEKVSHLLKVVRTR